MLQKESKRWQSSKVDSIGMISSGLCALHCAALPILFSLGAIGGISSAAHNSFELLALMASIGIAAWSTWKGLKSHGRLAPQLLIAFGMLVLILGFLSSMHGIMAFGGMLLVGGHWFNHKYQIL